MRPLPPRRPISTIALSFAALLTLLFTGGAWGHPAPNSLVYLDFSVDGARVEQLVPFDELQLAAKRPIARYFEPAASIVERNRAWLEADARRYVQLSSAGIIWPLRDLTMEGVDEDGPHLRLVMRFDAPAGAADAPVSLRNAFVGHEVVTHYSLIYSRDDWYAGRFDNEPTLLGSLRGRRDTMEIAREGDFWRGFSAALWLGAEHISEGVDHLLFLLALLLVVPLTASAGRWRLSDNPRRSLMALLKVVSAFTVGHSVTLIFAALGGLPLPAASIEIAVAASIILTAAHGLRPLFPRREALVAAGFGLIHGLALSLTLAQRDLSGAQGVWTLLAFNLGIELMQIWLLICVAPWLMLMAQAPIYRWVRRAGAGVIFALACLWVSERAFEVSNPAAPALAWITAHPWPLWAVLACAASLAFITRPRAAALSDQRGAPA